MAGAYQTTGFAYQGSGQFAYQEEGGQPAPPNVVSGGWFPASRRRTQKELREERINLGILPPDVVEDVLPAVVAAPKARRKIVLAGLIGNKQVGAAKISALDIEEAVQAYRRRARQRMEDEELLLFH